MRNRPGCGHFDRGLPCAPECWGHAPSGTGPNIYLVTWQEPTDGGVHKIRAYSVGDLIAGMMQGKPVRFPRNATTLRITLLQTAPQ